MSPRNTEMCKRLWLALSVALPIASTFPAWAQSGNGAVVYSYDALGRVTGASYDNNTTITYSYDAAGNRIQQSVAIGSPPGFPPSPPPAPGLLPGSSQWTTVGSGIYYSGGNVGIGTASPSASLHVTGNGQLKITSTTSGIPPHVYMSDGTRDYAAGVFSSIYSIRDYSSGGVDRLVVDGSGNVGIGTASPTYALHVSKPAPFVALDTTGAPGATGAALVFLRSTAMKKYFGLDGADNFDIFQGNGSNDSVANRMFLFMNASTGTVGLGAYTAGGPQLDVGGVVNASGGFTQTSDRRLKEKIKSLPIDGLTAVEKLRPVSFVWKMPKDGMKGEQFGFIAQEVEKVLPQVVSTAKDQDKTKGLKYDELIPVLTLAVQQLSLSERQLQTANEAQAEEIRALRSEIETLKSHQMAAAAR